VTKSIAKPNLTANRIRWNVISVNADVLWRPMRFWRRCLPTYNVVRQHAQRKVDRTGAHVQQYHVAHSNGVENGCAWQHICAEGRDSNWMLSM
jgi:hypothetical protein